jgi:hypothetical protein
MTISDSVHAGRFSANLVCHKDGFIAVTTWTTVGSGSVDTVTDELATLRREILEKAAELRAAVGRISHG